MNRIIQLVIFNAAVSLLLKSLNIAAPIFTIYNQIFILSSIYLSNNPVDKKFARTCIKDPVCSTIQTLGKIFFLIHLTIPFLFFHKFDLKFKACFHTLVESIKKLYKKKQERKK